MSTTQTEAPAPDSTDAADRTPAHLGANELGRIDVSNRVVEKIAARAAGEVPDAGGPSARVLGRQVPGAGRMGIGAAGLDRLPNVSAEVEGSQVFLDVGLSVRWPAPVGQVTDRVRQQLRSRLTELVGLEVREINVEIVDLVTETPTARVE